MKRCVILSIILILASWFLQGAEARVKLFDNTPQSKSEACNLFIDKFKEVFILSGGEFIGGGKQEYELIVNLEEDGDLSITLGERGNEIGDWKIRVKSLEHHRQSLYFASNMWAMSAWAKIRAHLLKEVKRDKAREDCEKEKGGKP